MAIAIAPSHSIPAPIHGGLATALSPTGPKPAEPTSILDPKRRYLWICTGSESALLISEQDWPAWRTHACAIYGPVAFAHRVNQARRTLLNGCYVNRPIPRRALRSGLDSQVQEASPL